METQSKPKRTKGNTVKLYCQNSNYAPKKAHEGDVGFDLFCQTSLRLLPNHAKPDTGVYKIKTGVFLEMPKGMYATIHLRSSVGANTRLRLANQVGIIDNNYRGELILLIENVGRYATTLIEGQRIAQLIFHKEEAVTFETLESKEAFTGSERNEAGLGSSGK